MIRLCSASASRAKLLDNFGVSYIQQAVNFDEESIKSDSPRVFVYRVAKGKMERARQQFGLEIPLLTADTVISVENRIVRKAKDIDDAREILLCQSGNKTSIITALIYRSKKLEFIDIAATHYHFAKFDLNDLESYLQSGQWQGKAGACMVEGFCKKYIQKVEGLESNAMGLQVEKLLPWLEF